LIAEKNAFRAAMHDVDGKHLGMIPDRSTGLRSLDSPFGDQSFRKFTLGVFVAENRPPVARIKRAL
jgi:hypothetical protein